MIDKEAIDRAIKNSQIPDSSLLDKPSALSYALHSAVRIQNSELVEWLLEKGADVEAYDEEGLPPLHVAVCYPYAKIAGLLCEHGANVNAKDNTPSEATPLHWALTTKNIKVIRFLLNRGADVNVTGRGGYSPLHKLIGLYNEEHCSEEWLDKEIKIMSLLLEHGANPNAAYTQTGCELETLLSLAMDIPTSITNNRRNKMTKLLMLHISLENPDGDKPDRVANIPQLSQLWEFYLTEIKALRNENIGGGYSYYDFCKEDFGKLVKAIPERELNAFKEKELENQFANFHYFSNLLKNKLEKLEKKDDILTEAEDQIELILIQQSHPINKADVVSEGIAFSDDDMNETIYSQFKIMQILQLYPNAVILAEGNTHDVTVSDRDKKTTYMFRSIFPEYKDFNKMEFDNLTENQRIVLTKNFGVQALFHIGIINNIYQTTNSELDMKKLTTEYRDSYRETLMRYPLLAVTALQKGSISLKDLDTLQELEDYEKFKKAVSQKNPCMFREREKEALDFSIIAAKKSGKKQVILIFGSDHVEGFVNLIQTTYCNKILLKECIDSREGFNSPDTRNKLKIKYAAAIEDYKSSNYKRAIDGFKPQVCFWQSTPNSTPHKSQSRLTAEFNLGSAFFKLAESCDASFYKDAIPHLKNAVTISCELYKQPLKNTKYVDRYSEAVNRHNAVSCDETKRQRSLESRSSR